jgi:hypothetical protein
VQERQEGAGELMQPVNGSISYLRYLWYRMREPAVGDFLDVGIGIDLRARRFRGVWEHHLARTRGFIVEATKDGGDEVVVLGAGQLRDCPLHDLVDRFSRVVLVDIDPRAIAWCRRFVRRFGNRVVCERGDLTGVVVEWSAALSRVRYGLKSDVTAVLKNLSAPERRWSSDTVISLNVLSQLGVMWRDRVARIVGSDVAQSDDVAEATSESIARLEGAHSGGMARARRTVLIADRFFFSGNQRGTLWEVEDALYGPWPEQLPERSVWLHGSWLWQLVPAGGEGADEEIVHEVWARAFR